MSLFHRVQFEKPDPLDDGTAEEIAAEQQEAGLGFLDDNSISVIEFWEGVSEKMKKDPEYSRSNKK
jgi:hypothetical protein